MPEQTTGVETASVAGEQQAVESQEEGLDLSFLEDETGVEKEEPAAAGQEGEEVQDRVEQAFAKRLAQEREKIRRELEEEEFRQRYQQPTYQPTVQPLPPPPSLEERAQKLAEEWMITPEAARAFILQEERQRQLESRLYLLQDDAAKARAKTAIEAQRKQNPHLPSFDEQQLLTIRLRYYDQYGVVPTWEDAYKMHVADLVARGELGRAVEQKVISQITGRDKVNVQVGRAEQPQKRNIADLSDEEFEKLKEKAKRGELKKT